MTNNKCHTVRIVGKYSCKIGERGKSNIIQKTQRYVNAHISGLVQALEYKSSEAMLVLSAQSWNAFHIWVKC
jgi:hypothetical protein